MLVICSQLSLVVAITALDVILQSSSFWSFLSFPPFFKKNSDLLSVSLFLPSSFLHSVHTEISFVRLPVRPSDDLSLAGNRLSVEADEAGCAAAVADRGSSSNVVDAVSALLLLLLLPLLLLLLVSLMWVCVKTQQQNLSYRKSSWASSSKKEEEAS